VPWTFTYYSLTTSAEELYRPLRLLVSRLKAPLATIHCRRGRAEDLALPANGCDRETFVGAVQAYYARTTGSGIKQPESN
jgi:capsular polysaccharide export protein